MLEHVEDAAKQKNNSEGGEAVGSHQREFIAKQGDVFRTDQRGCDNRAKFE